MWKLEPETVWCGIDLEQKFGLPHLSGSQSSSQILNDICFMGNFELFMQGQDPSMVLQLLKEGFFLYMCVCVFNFMEWI